MVRNLLKSAQGDRDRYIWPKERNDRYSVRSGYHVMKESHERKENVGPFIFYKVENRL